MKCCLRNQEYKRREYKRMRVLFFSFHTGGIREAFDRPREPTTGISDKALFLSRREVDEVRVIGALIREPELVRYVIPVPVLGFGRMALVVLSGGGERGTGKRREDLEIEVEGKTEGTGTAARSLPFTPA
jgi:hypothetical protein